jgi:patatin-like phospholipase/acyl hydrolase
MEKYRILSLDGGGPWALIQVMALQELYGKGAHGHDILRDFDLVAANSGGSFTLGGLIENFTLSDLLSNYFLNEARRKAVFSRLGLGEKIKNAVFELFGIAPKYSTAEKLAAIETNLPNFGSAMLPDIPPRIAASSSRLTHFCGFDYDRRRAVFFRSDTGSRAASSAPTLDVSLAEALNASSTAPVRYFDAPANVSTARFWDGAIAGYNNPVLGGVVEALSKQVPRDDIQVLSIGTGSVRLPIETGANGALDGLTRAPQRPSPTNDVAELAGGIIDDPPDAATFIAHVVLGQPLPDPQHPVTTGNVVRMNPMIQPVRNNGHWELPAGLSHAQFKDLSKLDFDVREQCDIVKVRHLSRQWLADKVCNQPIRSDSQTFRCEIGHPTFSTAKAKWMSLKAQPGNGGPPVA